MQPALPGSAKHLSTQFLTTHTTMSSKQVTQPSERLVPILMQFLVPGSAPRLLLPQSSAIFFTSFAWTMARSAALVQAPIAIMPVPVELVLVAVPVLVPVPVLVLVLVLVPVVALPPVPVALEEPPAPPVPVA